jgi:uncharacterized protein
LPKREEDKLFTMTDLEHFIQTTPLVDTHEHLNDETAFVETGPDILQSVFDHYTFADLLSAGATPTAIEALRDRDNPDIRARFEGIKGAWERSQFTGYGEGVRYVAKHLFGIEEISVKSLERAAPLALAMHQPGERLRLLKDVARLEHVQIDDFTFSEHHPNEPEFFLYDLNWLSEACGNLNFKKYFTEVGIEVRNLASLQDAFEAMFAKHAPAAIALKTQHAYERTLHWSHRENADAERVLLNVLRDETLSAKDKLCLGDWCLAQGVELATQHQLPVKIHTGYAAGNNQMSLDDMRAVHLSPLVQQYPQSRFVLMHASYPYMGEILAMAKHYTNVYLDMCWVWSINPYSSETFLRQFIHSVPSNKLFLFGGDSFWPHASVAYAWQARRGLTNALQAEIREGVMSERQATELASRFMRENQYECFRLTASESETKAKASSG